MDIRVKRHKTYDAERQLPSRFNIDGTDKAYKGYVGGSNYCMEIWIDEEVAGKAKSSQLLMHIKLSRATERKMVGKN